VPGQATALSPRLRPWKSYRFGPAAIDDSFSGADRPGEDGLRSPSLKHSLTSLVLALARYSRGLWRLHIAISRSAAATFAVLLALPGNPPQAQQPCPARGSAIGRVAAVNERLDLTLEDGAQLKIAGIEPVRPTPDDPERDVKAREDLASWLLGQIVEYRRLEPGHDRWGRAAAFVFAAVPGGTGETGARQTQNIPLLPVGESILEAGLGRYEPSIPDDPCRNALLAAEARARASGLGLWADRYYAALGPGGGEPVAELAGSTVIFEGTVSVVHVQRPRITLHLGRRPGVNFSVTLVPRNSKAFEAAISRLAGLSGQTVRARGLLDLRFGPQIEISNLDAVEVLGPEQAAATSGSPK